MRQQGVAGVCAACPYSIALDKYIILPQASSIPVLGYGDAVSCVVLLSASIVSELDHYQALVVLFHHVFKGPAIPPSCISCGLSVRAQVLKSEPEQILAPCCASAPCGKAHVTLSGCIRCGLSVGIVTAVPYLDRT
jgi:hypothetical protein